MLLFIAAATAIIAIVFIALGYPVFYGKSEEVAVETYIERQLGELLSRKETLYSAIKELDFDFKTNKLSEKDYKELKERYRRDTISILKEIDEVEKGEDMDALVEKDIIARRKFPSSSGGTEKMEESEDMETSMEKEILAHRKSSFFCPDCGSEYGKDDKFCSKCGRELK